MVALVLDSKILARPAGATSDFFIGRRRRRRRRRRECSVLALFFQPLTPPSARSPLFRFSSPSIRAPSLSIGGRLPVAFLLSSSSSSSSVVRRFIFVGLVLSSLFSPPLPPFLYYVLPRSNVPLQGEKIQMRRVTRIIGRSLGR